MIRHILRDKTPCGPFTLLRLSLVVTVVLYLAYTRFPGQQQSPSSQNSLPNLDCGNLPGAEDVLVVLKTGATEIGDRLPAHLSTTFECYPHLLIFADYEGQFEGLRISDALETVDPQIVQSHHDFDLYQRIKEHGLESLASSELSSAGAQVNSAAGKPENPGWKLDKWKFIPMAIRTLQEYPNQKWYLFIETDTFIFWSTLLQYLSSLDETRNYYIGSQMQIGEVLFAHGGSGFVISNPALRDLVSQLQGHQHEWETFTDGHWAGDCVLGKALNDTGSPVLWAWPIFQDSPPGTVPYAKEQYAKRLWCYPSVSYHHISPAEVKDLWLFEQNWLVRNKLRDTRPYIRHKDVFEQFIMPRMKFPRVDWDNGGTVTVGHANSASDCEKLCLWLDSCMQYALQADGDCTVSNQPQLGNVKTGTQSGWIYRRIQEFANSMAPCGNETWIT